MNHGKVYEIKAPSDQIDPFLSRLTAYLERSGYEERVHLHEPPQQEEILQFGREGAIISIEADRQSLEESVFRISSETVDPESIVLEVLSDLCADLVATFVRPIAAGVDRGELDALFKREIEGYIERKRSE